jgi:signal transduction histidine kinase
MIVPNAADLTVVFGTRDRSDAARAGIINARHLTDLLLSRNINSDERKAHYYALLAGETERLHRLVESLLSFGRIDAGAYAWQVFGDPASFPKSAENSPSSSGQVRGTRSTEPQTATTARL